MTRLRGIGLHFALMFLALLALILLLGNMRPAHAASPSPYAVQCVTGPCKWTHIATNTSTQVKTGAGFLHAITINTKGGSANVVTVYDHADCTTTVIATIDSTATPGAWLLDVAFTAGLCVKTATGTAADLTVSAR